MKVKGIEGLSAEQINAEVQQGAKFVTFLYCISVVFMTFKRGSDIYFIRPGENAVVKGLQYTLTSLFLGWWGLPWGLVYTPHALFVNLRGGKDLTAQVMASLVPAAASGPASGAPDFDLGPQNPW